MNMTKESLAALLNGREYGNEITRDEIWQAKAAGLVVVFGYSDDTVEFRGAISDEVGCYGEKSTLLISPKGVAEKPDRDEREVLEEFDVLQYVNQNTREIQANFGGAHYSWTFATDIPHATFEVLEGDEKFCRGIVFSLAEAFAKKEGQ